MLSLRNFAAWITYAVASGVADWRLGAALATVVAAREVRAQRRAHGEVDDLARATRWFFLGLTALSVLSPHSPLHHYTPALSLAALGLAAADSLLRGAPFTLTFARRSAPEALWQHPAFVRANVVITRVWAASFLAGGALCALLLAEAPGAAWAWLTVEIVAFVTPVAFTTIYRDRARARFAAGSAA